MKHESTKKVRVKIVGKILVDTTTTVHIAALRRVGSKFPMCPAVTDLCNSSLRPEQNNHCLINPQTYLI